MTNFLKNQITIKEDSNIVSLKQQLRDEIFKEKKKINRLIITQIKEIKELDDKTRDEIKEVIFIRTKRLIISTLNVGLFQTQKKAVMLYSDTYSPSLYYKYHLDEIKKIL